LIMRKKIKIDYGVFILRITHMYQKYKVIMLNLSILCYNLDGKIEKEVI